MERENASRKEQIYIYILQIFTSLAATRTPHTHTQPLKAELKNNLN